MLTILLISVCLYGAALGRTVVSTVTGRSKHLLAALVSLTLAASVHAGVDDAVVLVDGCSGVCVDSSGLVMTARHCNHPTTVSVQFKDRTVSATRVYVCRETEGPVVYDCEGDDYPHLPVAASPPRIGERLWSYGYPQVHGRRELRWASGPLVRWSTFQYAGGSFKGNVVAFVTGPGWSGGPLLNSKGEVCGLLNSTDCATSVFISSAAVRQAYATARQQVDREQPADDGKPRLFVFGSMSCGPCRQFKDDFANNEPFRKTIEAAFAVEFVDIDKQRATAERFGVTEVPTFIVPGTIRITGYQGPDQLLVRLAIREEITERPQPEWEPVEEPEDSDPEPEDSGQTSEDAELVDVPQTPADREQQQSTESSPENAQPAPARNSDDRIDRVAGLVEKAVTLATWLGVTGATGGTGGLILGGIALWRTLRRRRKRTARDPPHSEASNEPPVITIDSPPPPQAIVPETRFAPYERDTFAEAFAWAETEMARKYPGSVGTMESIRGLIDQYLTGRGVKRDAH